MDGRPLLTQEPVPEPQVEQATVTQQEERADALRRKLQFGPLSDSPTFERQEEMFPDSVVEIGMRFEMLDTGSKEDMNRYSALSVSSRQRGAEVIVAEDLKWSETSGAWKILVKVSKRMFRALTAAHEAELLKETKTDNSDDSDSEE
jgi:hypothetical protein